MPGLVEAFGGAATNATVTVNNTPVTRHNDYWYKSLSVNNGPSGVYTQLYTVGVVITGANIVTEKTNAVFVAKTPESFTHDSAAVPKAGIGVHFGSAD